MFRAKFLICAVLFFCFAKQSHAQNQNLLAAGDTGVVTSHKLTFQSYSTQKFRVGYSNEISISSKSNLLSYLFREEIRRELELTDEQLSSVENLRPKYEKAQSDLVERLTEFEESEQDDIHKSSLGKWLEEQISSSKNDLDFLLPFQKELLEKVRVNYLVAIYGHSRMLQHCKQLEMIDVSQASLTSFAKAQKRTLPELRKKCQLFLSEELKNVASTLDPKQRESLGELVNGNLFFSMPELVAAQSSLIHSEDISKPSSKYSVWGCRSCFTLEYDGKFSLKMYKNDALSFDYLVNALHKNRKIQSELELLDYQIEQFGASVEAISELNSDVGRLLEKGNHDEKEERSIIEKWQSEKKTLALKHLDSILLDFQKSMIGDLSSKIENRRFGIHWALTKGALGEALGLSAKQKKQIESSAEELGENYSEFSKDTTSWYLNQLCSEIQDENDRQQIKKLFDHDFKFLRLPLGSLCRSTLR